MTICYSDDNNLIPALLEACSLNDLKKATYDVISDMMGCCALQWDNTTAVDPVTDPAQANIDSGFDQIDCNTVECPVSFLIDTGATASAGVATMYWSDDCGTTWYQIGGGSTAVTMPRLVLPFEYTGADQLLTIPAGYTQMEMYVWGASGGFRNQNPGSGGMAYGVQAVVAGEEYSIMVGENGGVNTGLQTYGFGGASGAAGQNSGGGGGLSGVFTGNTPILATDAARALVIGGGGGGCSTNGSAEGNNGGSPTSGTGLSGNFQGDDGGGQNGRDPAGGGGFLGGSAGDQSINLNSGGGSSFALGTLTNAGTIFQPDQLTISYSGTGFARIPVGGYDHPFAPQYSGWAGTGATTPNGYVTIILS